MTSPTPRVLRSKNAQNPISGPSPNSPGEKGSESENLLISIPKELSPKKRTRSHTLKEAEISGPAEEPESAVDHMETAVEEELPAGKKRKRLSSVSSLKLRRPSRTHKISGCSVNSDEKSVDISGWSKIPESELSENYSTLLSGLEDAPIEQPTEKPIGFLYSQLAQHPHACIYQSPFAIGRHWRCDLQLGDNSISRLFCRIIYRDGQTFLDSLSRNGRLYVNSRPLPIGIRTKLESGDEINIVSGHKYSYLYSSASEALPFFNYSLDQIPSLIKPSDPIQETHEHQYEKSNPTIYESLLKQMTRNQPNNASQVAPFPFYVNAHLKKRLYDAFDILLNHSELSKVTSKLSSISRGILLAGPPGSDSYCFELIQSLASELSVNFLALDDEIISSLFSKSKPRRSSCVSAKRSADFSSSKADVILPTEFSNSHPKENINEDCVPSVNSLMDSSVAEIEKPLGEEFALTEAVVDTLLVQQSAIPKVQSVQYEDDVEDDLEDVDDESLESFVVNLPTLSANREARVNMNPIFSKSYIFKVGDKVRYLGTRSSLSRFSKQQDGTKSEEANLEPDPEADLNFPLSPKKVISTSLNACINVFRGGLDNGKSSMRGPLAGCKGEVVMNFPKNQRKVCVRFERSIHGGLTIEKLGSNLFFVPASELRLEAECENSMEDLGVNNLLSFCMDPKNQPLIVFVKNLESSLLNTREISISLADRLKKIESPLVLVGFTNEKPDSEKSSPRRDKMFPHFIFMEGKNLIPSAPMRPSGKSSFHRIFTVRYSIVPPTNEKQLIQWNSMLEQNLMASKIQNNWNILTKSLLKCGVTLTTASALTEPNKWMGQMEISPREADMVVESALAFECRTYPGGVSSTAALMEPKMSLHQESFLYGLRMLYSKNKEYNQSKNRLTDLKTDNDYEKALLTNVICSTDINIDFEDIGSLESVKNALFELVILPLRRPELFKRGNLTKPCKGILLFGPPGTGKTMLAKAIASQSCANFLNISMSSVTSKWVGEGEKYAKAVFTLASKLAPCVIFVDEIDSMLGRRDSTYEHEGMRKIKNEFMTLWDGLTTKSSERVILLAATNRPHDLDDAVLRRMPRRVMVDLPDAEQRIKILKVILKDESLVENFDYAEVANKLENFSGSDIRNLAVAAAYRPIREFIALEKKKNSDLASHDPINLLHTFTPQEPLDFPDDDIPPHVVRPLTVHDFLEALEQVSPSCSENSTSITELRKWNETYGEGANKKIASLSYFM